MTTDSREMVTNEMVTNSESVADKLKALRLPDNRTGLEGTAKAHLDLLLMALEVLCDEGSEAMLAAARDLSLDGIIGDRVTLWRLRNANPLRKSSGGRKKVDIDEIRALVLVTCYWARQQHAVIRTTIERLELCIADETSPLKDPRIADFLDGFHTGYRDRMVDGLEKSQKDISELGLSLLVELLFYGSLYGPDRLWTAILNRPQLLFPEEWDAPTELDPGALDPAVTPSMSNPGDDDNSDSEPTPA